MGVLTYTSKYTLKPYLWCINWVVGCLPFKQCLGRSVGGVLVGLGEDPLGIRDVAALGPATRRANSERPGLSAVAAAAAR